MMNGKHVCTLVVSASLSLMAAAGAEDFPSLEMAMVGFSTNTAAARERAYRYVLGRTKSMNGLNVRPTLRALSMMASALNRDAEYDGVCMAGIASNSHESVRFACATALLQSPSALAGGSNHLARIEMVARDSATLNPTHRIELLGMIADVRLRELSDATGATRGLDEAIDRAGRDKDAVRQLRLKKVELFRSAKMDEALEKEARLVLSDAECPPESYQAASYALVDLALAGKDVKRAGEMLLDVIRKSDTAPAGIAARLAGAAVDAATLDAAVVILRTRLAGMPLDDATAFRSAVGKIQPEVVGMLCRLGRFDEALAECRVLVLLSLPAAYQDAVSLTASVLKQADGNLGRAIAFMNYQRKGLVPKGRNILLDAPQLADGVRAETRKSLPVGGSGSWEESLAVSARLVWLDDPLASVQEAMRAFSLAPFDGVALQACADAVMLPLLTVTRDPDSAKGVVDYLMYGANGPDGAKGTRDDLPSPFENLAEVLKLGPGK